MASKYSKKRAFEDEDIWGKRRRPNYDYVIATTMRGSGFYLVSSALTSSPTRLALDSDHRL